MKVKYDVILDEEREADYNSSVIRIAASNARDTSNADYVCDGTADEVQLGQAITALGSTGGTIILSEGTFNFSSPSLPTDNVKIVGQGYSTYIKNSTNANAPLFKNSDQTSGNTGINISNMRIDGNKANQTADFSCIYFKKVTKFRLEDLWISNALRTATRTFGEGVRLTLCTYAFIKNIEASYCDYDGVKLWGTKYSVIDGIIGIDNATAALQLTYDTVVTSDGSDHNTISNVNAYHSTGTPGTYSNQTAAIILHGGMYNSFSNISAYGTQVGIQGLDGFQSNTFDGMVFRTRYDGTNAVIQIKDAGTPDTACGNNSWNNLIVKPLSGASGKYVAFSTNGTNNSITNAQFMRGSGTGTWTFEFNSSTHNFIGAKIAENYSVSDNGSQNRLEFYEAITETLPSVPFYSDGGAGFKLGINSNTDNSQDALRGVIANTYAGNKSNFICALDFQTVHYMGYTLNEQIAVLVENRVDGTNATTTNSYGVLTKLNFQDKSGMSIGTHYGFRANGADSILSGGKTGAITNFYGFYMPTLGGTGVSYANRWGIYIDDATAKNYFGGSVGIGTAAPRSTLSILNSSLPRIDIAKSYTDATTAPTTPNRANMYLLVGGQEYNTSSYRNIGFGYNNTTTTHMPAYIGFIERSNSNLTKGDLVFATRDVETDTQPTERLNISAAGDTTATGKLSSTGSGGVGYSTGAGGTVTQNTSKSTAVQIDKTTGTITMNNASLGGFVATEFTVTNSTVAATDIPVVAIKSGASGASYLLTVSAVAAGSFKICIYNLTAVPLSEAVVLSFAVIKGVAS